MKNNRKMLAFSPFILAHIIVVSVLGFHCIFALGINSAHAEQNQNTVQEFVLTEGTQDATLLSELMKNMQMRYEAMHSLTASFRQELRHRDSGADQVNDGILQWRKPLLVRWEVLGVNAELFIVEANSIWNYFPDEELAYRYPLNLVENSMDIIKVVTGQSSLIDDFSVVDEGVESLDDGRRVARLHLYPHEPVQNFTEAVLWLDMESYLIERVLIYDFYGNENDVTFQNVAPDTEVADEAITFTPPAGTEVIDQRQ